MGMLDMITGGLSLESFTPFILKEMKKSGAVCFVVTSENEKINVDSYNSNLLDELKEKNRQLELLKIEYLKLKKELHALKNQNNGRD
jgi:hypothetical protein